MAPQSCTGLDSALKKGAAPKSGTPSTQMGLLLRSSISDFTPFGFTANGSGLYGSFKINNLGQFAVFAIDGVNTPFAATNDCAAAARIQSAVPSPDGARYAILADPRPADDLAETRGVIEPDQVSIYVIKSDGTAGQWWCPDLKYIASGPLTGGNPSIAWSPRDGSLLHHAENRIPLRSLVYR